MKEGQRWGKGNLVPRFYRVTVPKPLRREKSGFETRVSGAKTIGNYVTSYLPSLSSTTNQGCLKDFE